MYYVYVFSGQYKTSILKLSLVIAIEIQFLGSANLIFKIRIEKTQERAKTQHESKCMLHFGDFTKNVALMLTSWESLLLSPNTQLYQRFQKKKKTSHVWFKRHKRVWQLHFWYTQYIRVACRLVVFMLLEYILSGWNRMGTSIEQYTGTKLVCTISCSVRTRVHFRIKMGPYFIVKNATTF